jgi:DNA repair protein RecO (recombination protein O)
MSELHKMKGIFLHQVKYSDSSVIAKIYTDTNGMQSFVVRGVGKSKKNKKTGLLQPLMLLDIIAYVNPKRDIHQVKEIGAAYHFKSIQQKDVVKSSIAVFINEMVYKSIREQEQNQALFDFLSTSIKYLDLSEQGYVNFHLLFAMQFSKYLGFYPSPDHYEHGFFDLREGQFKAAEPLHTDYLSAENTRLFKQLLSTDYADSGNLHLTNRQRRDMLNNILAYFAFHLQGFGEMKSHHVLEAVLS